MKKLLAVLLSVVMTMCLTVPAFAAPAPEAGSLGIIGGADGPTAIITSGPISPEDFKWDGYLDPADWVNQLDQRAQAYRDELKKSLGGVPGQIGVMVNGEYVQFPDAVPEIKDGCAMVPIRALADVLGGQVAYGEEEKEQLVKAADKTYLSFSVGNPQVIVEYPSGSGELVSLSCAPYIKNDRAYVPVRFMGEILGYEVGWDADYQTAILLDRDALAAEIDKDFTILNKVQAARSLTVENGKTLREDLKASATVTAFDTLNGNKTYQADLTGKTLLNSQAASGSYSLTLSDNIIDLLLKQMELDGEDTKIVRNALEGLEDIQLIMTQEGKLWFHAAALDVIGEEENLWYGTDMGAEFGKLLLSATGDTTVGTVLAAMAGTGSVEEWSAMEQAVQMMAALYGDDKFTTSGGTSTLTLGLKDLVDLFADYGLDLDDVKDAFKKYSITMKVDSKGGVSVKCVVETNAQSGVPAVKLTADCTQSGGKADLTMSLHIANIGELTLTMSSTQQTGAEKPMSEPPKGANVVDNSAELLNP